MSDAKVSCRLDQALLEREQVASRSLARRLILAGRVRVNGEPASKAGMLIRSKDSTAVTEGPRFVSRGGDKLAGAIETTGVDPSGRMCLDAGASTGGFTDCLLQAGARHVVAVDVGYGQLDWRLRNDERVAVVERTNARHLTIDMLPTPERPSLIVVDVAFISATKLLPALTAVGASDAEMLLLVKPQFEAGAGQVGKGGVVRRESVRRSVLQRVAESAAESGWSLVAAAPSPLRGPAGNWECFLHLRRSEATESASADEIIDELAIPDDHQAKIEIGGALAASKPPAPLAVSDGQAAAPASSRRGSA